MSVRLQIAGLVWMMAQAVLFGVGTIIVLATPMAGQAMYLMPWVVASSFVISLPVSWLIAPRLQGSLLARRGHDAQGSWELGAGRPAQLLGHCGRSGLASPYQPKLDIVVVVSSRPGVGTTVEIWIPHA